MKITINGKKCDLGGKTGRLTCKVGFEKAAMLAEIPISEVTRIMCKHKAGAVEELLPGFKCIVSDGAVFTIKKVTAQV